MNLTFQSQELGRSVAIGEVHDMELPDARRFHVELTLAIQAMDDAILEAHRLDNEAGVPFDKDWMHRTRKKRRITVAFATEAKRRLLKLEGVEGADLNRKRTLIEAQREKFTRMKAARLKELLKEELGPGVYEEIENDAHEGAEEEFKAWLADNGYEQLYVT
jgi:hypothetical protein